MPNTIIQQTFTYDLPDDYLAQTNADGRTATANYNGPDKIWVFIDRDTGKSDTSRLVLTEEEDGADFPIPEDQYKVEINCATDPVLCSLFDAKVEWDTVVGQTNIVVNLPDGTTYERPDPTDVDHTYELDECAYNLDGTNTDGKWTGGTWTMQWKQPWTSWEQLITVRNNMLAGSDSKIADDMPAATKQLWLDYRQALRDLPATFGRGTANEIPAYMVNFPVEPGADIATVEDDE
jgi:hypothetical protein